MPPPDEGASQEIQIVPASMRYYVNPDPNVGDDDNNDGLTPETPFRTLQKAVDSVPVSTYATVIAAWDDEVGYLAAEEREQLREEARKLAIARRDARWAELDARDAAKAAAKEQKKLEKKRVRTKKAVLRQMKQDAKDEAKLQKYVERFRNKKRLDTCRLGNFQLIHISCFKCNSRLQ